MTAPSARDPSKVASTRTDGAPRPQNFEQFEGIVRALTPVLIALVTFAGIWSWSQFSIPPRASSLVVAVFVLQVIILWQILRVASRLLDRLVSAHARLGIQLVAQAFAGMLVSIGYGMLLLVPARLWSNGGGVSANISLLQVTAMAVLSIALSLAWIAQETVLRLYRRWQLERIESAAQSQAALRAELDALKSQVNPHFLFNSLNTLYGMIDEQPLRARELVIEMSDVFRYALTHGHQDLVPLSQELNFLNAFRAILSARHGAALEVVCNTGGNEEHVAVPPMTLQLLVENAVKHNRVDADHPLKIEIVLRGENLSVSNSLKPRRGEAGTGAGLKNIDQRCRLLAGRGIEVRRTEEQFEVMVPILPC